MDFDDEPGIIEISVNGNSQVPSWMTFSDPEFSFTPTEENVGGYTI